MLKTGENLCLNIHTAPSMDLAMIANGIGSRAWRDRFTHRGEVGVRQVFDPHRPDRLLTRMEKAAEVGRFAGVVALAHDPERDTKTPIGALWVADDMGGLSKSQQIMRQAFGARPQAHVAQVDVLPDHQRQGVGTAMLTTVLDQFNRIDTSSVHILGENEPAKAWLEKVGYSPWPPEPEQVAYFGDDAELAEQWRLSGFVSTIQTTIAKQYPELPVDQIEYAA